MKQRITITPAHPGSTQRSLTDLRGDRPDRGRTNVLRPFVVEGDFDFEVEELGSFVRVTLIVGVTQVLTYEDPTGELRLGDLVDVPYGYDNRLKLGRVTALDRGGYTGPTKAVAAKLHREALA